MTSSCRCPCACCSPSFPSSSPPSLPPSPPHDLLLSLLPLLITSFSPSFPSSSPPLLRAQRVGMRQNLTDEASSPLSLLRRARAPADNKPHRISCGDPMIESRVESDTSSPDSGDLPKQRFRSESSPLGFNFKFEIVSACWCREDLSAVGVSISLDRDDSS
eukprot:213322-Hanusia_phi.AAC.1